MGKPGKIAIKYDNIGCFFKCPRFLSHICQVFCKKIIILRQKSVSVNEKYIDQHLIVLQLWPGKVCREGEICRRGRICTRRRRRREEVAAAGEYMAVQPATCKPSEGLCSPAPSDQKHFSWPLSISREILGNVQDEGLYVTGKCVF